MHRNMHDNSSCYSFSGLQLESDQLEHRPRPLPESEYGKLARRSSELRSPSQAREAADGKRDCTFRLAPLTHRLAMAISRGLRCST